MSPLALRHGASGESPPWPSHRPDLVPVVQRSYDLCADLYQHIDRFPRAQRGLLGRVILEDALQTLTLVTIANRRADKAEPLTEASGRLDALRITLRLSKRLGFLLRWRRRGRAEARPAAARMPALFSVRARVALAGPFPVA